MGQKAIKDKVSRLSHSITEVNLGSDYSDDEREFMVAMEKHLRANKIRFPTCTDCLIVAKSLGYRKVT